MRRISMMVVAGLVVSALQLMPTAPAASAGGVLHVDVSASGAGDGSSWADAFTDLQDALAVAVAGDEIRVAEGTYRPHTSDPSVSFALVDGVSVVGGFSTGGVSGPDPDRFPTVLSGDLAADDLPGAVNISDNSHWVVTAGLVSTARLEGVVVTAGGNGLPGGLYPGAGGVRIEALEIGASADLVDVDIRDNNGAGVASFGIFTIEHSTVSGNGSWGILSGLAAAMTLRDSVVSDNEGSGIIGLEGVGGFLVERSWIVGNGGSGFATEEYNGVIRDSWFVGNAGTGINSSVSYVDIYDTVVAGNSDGGMWLDGGRYDIANSLILNNSTSSDGGGIAGNFYELGGSITNTVIAGNSAGGVGGGVLFGFGDLTVTNSVVTANSAGSGGGIVAQLPPSAAEADVDLTSGLDVANSIVWGNTPGPGIVDTGTAGPVAVAHSDVQGWAGGGVGNIDVDPLFVGPGNYRLQPTSPAREAGDNSVVPPDTLDVDRDGNTTEPTPDLDGRPRIAGVVDLGAYERPLPSILPGGVVVSPEGDSGSTIWQLPVTLSSPQPVPVSIDWTIGDVPTSPKVAHPGSDVVAASGTVTFAPGETSTTVPIEVLGDTVDEPALLYGEWGIVVFSNPSFATLDTSGLFGLGVFIIIDDDTIASNYSVLTGPSAPLEGSTHPADGSIPTPYLERVSGASITEGVGVDWYIDEVLFRDDDLNSPWNLGALTELPIGVPFTGQGTVGSGNSFLLGPGTHSVRAEASYPGGTKNFVATFTITP